MLQFWFFFVFALVFYAVLVSVSASVSVFAVASVSDSVSFFASVSVSASASVSVSLLVFASSEFFFEWIFLQVSYVGEHDTIEIASRITQDKEAIIRLSEILLTLTRRAATFRDKNSINADNINQAYISVSHLSEADIKFNNSPNKLKIMLKTAVVAANDVFKTRPKDQILALNAIGEIIVDVLKGDEETLGQLLGLMKTANERNEICNGIFKQLSQNITETKISFLNNIAKNPSAYDVMEWIEKVLGEHSEVKCEAFIKIAKIDPRIITFLVKKVKEDISKIKTEESAIELLGESIVSATKEMMEINLDGFIGDEENLREEAKAFAKSLGLGKIEEDLSEELDFATIDDKRTVEFLQRIILIRQLAERDFSLKSAIARIRKNPERARGDPRIRQLIRESAFLLFKGQFLRNSRDFPIQLLKNRNLLAIEDLLIQKGFFNFPVLISRDSLEVVIPKEASGSVFSGRVPYAFIDESGVSNFKPRHMFGNLEVMRESSVENEDRKYLQAKNSVRKLKKLSNNNSRQVA